MDDDVTSGKARTEYLFIYVFNRSLRISISFHAQDFGGHVVWEKFPLRS